MLIFNWKSILLQCENDLRIRYKLILTYFNPDFQWLAVPQPIIQVLLIIVSCLLAWGEAWFLDCRVVPQEKNAQRFYRTLVVRSIYTNGIFYLNNLRIIIMICSDFKVWCRAEWKLTTLGTIFAYRSFASRRNWNKHSQFLFAHWFGP